MAEPRNYAGIPVGDEVARVFPWWRYGTVTLLNGTAAGTQSSFVFGPQNAPVKNNLNVPLNINEIRFLFPNATGSTAITRSVQMRHTRYDLINRWLPVQALQTEESIFHLGSSSTCVATLPAPYFLQFGQTFLIDIRTNLPGFDATDRTIDVTLRGWDPDNDFPCVMSKQNEVGLTAGNAFTTIAFDDNRDAATRSMWIRDIAFGFVDADASGLFVQDVPFYFDIRFRPTTGPEWTEQGTWTSLAGLVDYIGVTTAGLAYRPIIVHRPRAPHILKPEEELRIKVLNQTILTADETYYCWVKGEQEGTHVR